MKRYITNNKKKFVKTLLTTTSFLVVAVSHDVMAGATARATSKGAVTAVFSNGAGFSGAAAPFATGSTLQFNAPKDADVNIADVNILAIDVHGKDLSKNSFKILENATIGSIVDLGAAGDALAPASTANTMRILFPAGASKTLTLSGTSSDGIGFKVAAGRAPEDNYSALGMINFTNQQATLSIEADSGGAITLDNATVENVDNATLDVKTDLTVKNASFAAIKTTKLTAGKNLTIEAGANDIATAANALYEFGNDSTLIYSVDTTAAAQKIDLKANIKNSLGGAADEGFNLIFRATGANTLNINGAAGVTIGTDGTHRVKELKLGGAANFVFDNNIDVFAKTITIDSTGEVTFNKAIDSGANSELNFAQAGKIKFAAVGANKITKIDFKNNDGTITFGDGAEFEDSIDSTGGGGAGNLIFEGASEIIGQIGGGNPLNLVKLEGDNTKNVIFKNKIKAKKLEFTSDGKLQLNDDGVIDELESANGVIKVSDAKTLEFTGNKNVRFDGNTIVFDGNDSGMKFNSTAANDVTVDIINNNFDTGNNARGVISLNANGATLTLKGQNLGAGNSLKEVAISGDRIVRVENEVNTAKFTIADGSTLSYAPSGDVSLNEVSFSGANSNLTLEAKGADRTFTLNKNIESNDSEAILKTNANGFKLTVVRNAAETIGKNNGKRLNQFIISGDNETEIDSAVFAKTITIDSTGDVTFNKAIDSGADSALNFAANGNINFKEDVTVSKMAFGNHDRKVILDAGKTLTLNEITSDAGSASELTLAGNGSNIVLNGANKTVQLDKIIAAKAGATNRLDAGDYTVTNIELNHGTGTLELRDGFNLTGGINADGGTNGKVKFLGNGKIIGVLGGNANAAGDVTIEGANTTLQLGSNVNVASLKGTAGNSQNLSFINNGNIEVTGNIGGVGENFDKITFNGQKVDFKNNNALSTNLLLHFASNTEVVTKDYSLGDANITTAAGGNKLVVNADQDITGDIGTEANPFGEINLDAAGQKNISINTQNFFAGVTGSNAVVKFNNAAGSSALYLGKDGTSIDSADFTQNATVKGGVFVKNIDIRDGKIATFENDKFVVENMTMHGANSQAEFKAKLTLNNPILANANSNGVIKFKEGVVLNQNIGSSAKKVAAVDIDKDSTISADLYADNINVANNSTLTFTKEATFDAKATSFTGTTLNLTNYDLTMTGGNVTFNGASKIETTASGNKLGNLVAGQDSKIILSGANTLEIKINDSNVLPTDGRNVTLIAKKDNGSLNMDLSKITVNSSGAFSLWTSDITDNGFVLTQHSEIQEVITESAEENGLEDVITKDVADAIENYEPNTKGEEFVLQLNQMNKPNIADSVARVANTTVNEVADVNSQIVNNISNLVSNRITEVGNFFVPTSTSVPSNTDNIELSQGREDYGTGLSSGDNHNLFGAWATPFYSKSEQKKISNASGFKADSYGGTLGFDTKVNEDAVLGAAFSGTNTQIKHKDFKSGDKTKISSYLLSLYGAQQFNDKWFGQAVLSFGLSHIINKENRRISDSQLAIAKANYDVMSFSSGVLAGYNKGLGNGFVLTPMFGLSYNTLGGISYKESGEEVGPQLMSVKRKTSHKLDLVGGVKFTSAPYALKGLVINPEIHAFIFHDVIGKSSKADATIIGLKLPSEKIKPQKTFYNVGASLNTSHGAMDYGISTDANFANKYVAVQGAIKLRVNF